MSLAILFHFLCAQHVSDINTSIIRSLRLFYCITTLVCVLILMCVGVSVWLVWVVSVWQAEAVLQPATRIPLQPNHTETPTHIETVSMWQAPDDECIHVRNMLSIEEMK